MVDAGETVMVGVVAPPGFQEYVPPPVAVSVVLFPIQRALSGPALATGNGLIFTRTLSLDVHPLALVTIT